MQFPIYSSPWWNRVIRSLQKRIWNVGFGKDRPPRIIATKIIYKHCIVSNVVSFKKKSSPCTFLQGIKYLVAIASSFSLSSPSSSKHNRTAENVKHESKNSRRMRHNRGRSFKILYPSLLSAARPEIVTAPSQFNRRMLIQVTYLRFNFETH